MFTIATATIADLNNLAPLFDAYRQFYGQAPDLPAVTSFLEERMRQQESTILMAYAAGQVAGFTQLYPIFTSVGLQKSLLLNDLFVAPAFRQRGLATALLEAAKKEAVANGCKWLLLQTGHDNKAAQAVYQKNGWQKVEDIFYQFNLQ